MRCIRSNLLSWGELDFVQHRILAATQRSIRAIAPGQITSQPERIHPALRIGRILIQIQPTRKFDRVRRDEAAYARIVIPMPVVTQPRLFINLLPLEQ